MPKNIKILFTGGHHNSTLATINELRKLIDFQCIWVGKKFVTKNTYTPEYQEVSKLSSLSFYNIKTGKIFRSHSLVYLPLVLYNLILIPVGFLYALYIILIERPILVVSFGGYIAVPFVIVSWIFKIPSVTHEQTVVLGTANKVIGHFVKKIYTAWPIKYYTSFHRKLHYVGLPLWRLPNDNTRKHIFERRNLPCVYVTGGKQGSLFINKLAFSGFDHIIKKCNVIWSTGKRIGEFDKNFIEAHIKKNFPDATDSVLISDYFESEIPYATCDFVISRAGGHTIYELAYLKKPAILIPILWTSNQEQYKNAGILQTLGLALVLDENKLDERLFLKFFDEFLDNLDNIKKTFANKSLVPADAAQKLADEICAVLKDISQS